MSIERIVHPLVAVALIVCLGLIGYLVAAGAVDSGLQYGLLAVIGLVASLQLSVSLRQALQSWRAARRQRVAIERLMRAFEG